MAALTTLAALLRCRNEVDERRSAGCARALSYPRGEQSLSGAERGRPVTDQPLPNDVLDALLGLSTPAVSNAIDALDVRPKIGFTAGPEIACQFPDLPVVVGYAVTVQVSAQEPPPPAEVIHRHTYWAYLASVPAPRVVVVKDMDAPSGQGAFLGEVNGAIHRGLGCVAAVTDGGFRDLPELRALGLQVFGPAPVTSAGYMHIVGFGAPVRIGRLLVRSGDLLHADVHGVLQVPLDAAARIPETAGAIRRGELEVLDLYHSGRFTLETLKQIRPR
jgi:regulator of RNase E activity RraA